jgi:hypothetical protein
MIKILLYTSDENFFEDISDALMNAGFWYDHISDIQSLKKAPFDHYDMLILHIHNQLELAEIRNLQVSNTPVICLLPRDVFGHVENYTPDTKICIESIFVPCHTGEFIQRLKNMVKNLDYYQRKYIIPGVSGSLKDYSFLDVLQAFMRKKYTGRLMIKEREYEGQIVFYEGTILDALCDPYEGLEAIDVMLFLEEADFEFRTEEIKPVKKIKIDMNTLLFHLLELYSEIEGILPQLPDRYVSLIKNPELKKDVQYLSDELQAFYEELPDLFNLMYLVFNVNIHDKLKSFEMLQALIRQEYIIQGQGNRTSEEKTSGFKKFLTKFFGKKETAEIIDEYEQFEQLYPDEYLKKRKLLIQLTQKDLKQLEQLLN